jgi:hypothetical protein
MYWDLEERRTAWGDAMRDRQSLRWATAHALLLLSIHAFFVWLACGLTIALGRGPLGTETTLIIHAVATPVYAASVAFVYFKYFHLTTPLSTATFFILFVVLMDALFVAPIFEKSYAMFSSPLGTWLPLVSIFAATYLVGVWSGGPRRPVLLPH